jgi:hypothetical protein
MAFNEEFYRRAISRENELLEQLKILKNEVNSLRSRVSIMNHPSHPAVSATSPKKPSAASFSNPEEYATSLMRSTDESDNNNKDKDGLNNNPLENEREQRLLYLKQAFIGFFRAKQPVEMQHLGRVICAILGMSVEEQTEIMESIEKLSPAVVATTTLESFSQSFASIFS